MTPKGKKMTDQGKNALAWPGTNLESVEPGSVSANSFSFDDIRVQGLVREVALAEIHISHGSFTPQVGCSFLLSDAAPCVRIILCIQGTSTYFHDASARGLVTLQPQQQTLLALPSGTLQMQCFPDEVSEVFIITLSPAFFFDQIPPAHPLYAHAQQCFEKSQPAVLNRWNLAVTPKMLTLLFDIMNGNEGHSRGVLVKAKVMELLALKLDQLEHMSTPLVDELLKDEDMARMQLARQLVIENLENPLSIKELAHRVGTNEYSLKKQFKAAFRTTIFGYLHDFRMEQAREQLCLNEATIAEIAQRAGYQHATHFTAAFKKYYGYLPTKLRLGLVNVLHLADHLLSSLLESTETLSWLEVV
jgi:AraC-like DNA-binding protein